MSLNFHTINTNESLESFINTNNFLIECNDIFKISKLIKACSQPRFSIHADTLTTNLTKVIDHLLDLHIPNDTCIHAGAMRHLFIFDHDQIIHKNPDDLCFYCKLCGQKSSTMDNWIIHINEKRCLITNPCVWFIDLYALPSLNRKLYLNQSILPPKDHTYQSESWNNCP